MIEDLAADAERKFGEEGLHIRAAGRERGEDCVLEMCQERANTLACLYLIRFVEQESG